MGGIISTLDWEVTFKPKNEKMKTKEFKKIVNFFFELAVLKKIPRAGWRNIGIRDPHSVGEHIFLTSQIAFILGKMEKINAERASLIALFHDNGEARVGDHNYVMRLYLKGKNAEKKAFFDQIKNLPGEKEMKQMYKEWEERKTKEAIVARDADYLELAIEAKCYWDLGNKLAEAWLKHIATQLKSKSAKKLFNLILKTRIDEWWQKGIPQIKREIC